MLIATMVARNEEEKFLRPVLEQVNKYADRIFFIDDHSDDNTVGIAQDFDAIIHRTSKPLFDAEGEAALRDFAWARLDEYARDGDWVLSINADEFFYPVIPPKELIEKLPLSKAVAVGMYHMWNENQYRVDTVWRPQFVPRLFRHLPNARSIDRPFAAGAFPLPIGLYAQTAFCVQTAGFRIKHMGFSTPELREQKHEWYSDKAEGIFSKWHINSILQERGITLEDWWEEYEREADEEEVGPQSPRR